MKERKSWRRSTRKLRKRLKLIDLQKTASAEKILKKMRMLMDLNVCIRKERRSPEKESCSPIKGLRS